MTEKLRERHTHLVDLYQYNEVRQCQMQTAYAKHRQVYHPKAKSRLQKRHSEIVEKYCRQILIYAVYN